MQGVIGDMRVTMWKVWLMLQQPYPDDYVLATGETHSVREFVQKAFNCIGRKSNGKVKENMRKGSMLLLVMY